MREQLSGMDERPNHLLLLLEQARRRLEELEPVQPGRTASLLAEIDRVLARARPTSANEHKFTPPNDSTPEGDGEVERLRREIERLKLSSTDRSLLDAVLDQSPHGIIISAPDGKLIHQNRSAERIWAGSATADTVEGWGKYRAFHSDGRLYEATDWSMYRALTKQETTDAEEVHFQRFDGSHGVLLGSAAPILDSRGALVGAVSVFADITRTKQVEKDLLVSQQWFATTLTSIGDAVIATDAVGKVEFINPVAEALTGWKADEAKGRALDEVFRIVNETTRLKTESPVDKVIREGGIVGLANHTALIRRDGSEVAIDDSAAPIRDDRGQLVGVVLVFRDVSEKRLEEARRELLVKASALLASTLDYESTLKTVAKLAVPGIADWCAVEIGDNPATSEQLAVAHVDPAKVEWACELRKRYPPDRAAAHGVPNVLRTGKPEFVAEIPDALLESFAQDAEHLQLIRGLGLKSYMVTPLVVGEDTLGAVTFVLAESGRRFGPKDAAFAEELSSLAALAIANARLYQAEKEARTKAEGARELEQQLIGIVSHDLRNPLNVVGMSAELLMRRGGLDEHQVKAVGRIHSASERATRMIRDFLDFTQARMGGGIPAKPQPANLHDLAQAAVDEIHLAHPERIVTIARNGDGEGEWDPDRISQAIGNLVGNAFQHSPADTPIRICTRGLREHVELEVTNEGPAIPADKLPDLFLPFRRGQEPKERPSGSIGLGLYIARQVVEAHGGTISVRSSGAEGTTFTVSIPRHSP